MFNRDKIEINEIFGPTVQGEGAAAGRHCLFIRVAQCNLECSWCDTAYTWAFSRTKIDKHIDSMKRGGEPYDKAENVIPMTVNEILNKVEELWPVQTKPTMIVISGGEPMMQQVKLIPLVQQLDRWGCDVHIETAGTIKPIPDFDKYITQYNVSPKLAHSGNTLTKRYKREVIDWFAERAQAPHDRAWFKFVIQRNGGMEDQDFYEVDTMVREHDIPPKRVMIMPEGNTIIGNIESAQSWSQYAIDRGYGISFRTHVLLWPTEVRGH